MEKNELFGQIQRKFIREHVRPFEGQAYFDRNTPTKEIEMNQNEIPTYRVRNENISPSNTMRTSLINEALPPVPIEEPSRVSEKYTPLEKIFENMNQQKMEEPVYQTPQHSESVNQYEMYNQNCPMCNNIYQTDNSGIYVTIIIILSVVILFLIKKIMI